MAEPPSIPLLKAGEESPSMFSASFSNRIISALNAIMRMEPGKGVKIYKSDANWKIEIDDAYLAEADTGGGLTWRGEWSADEDYEVDDVVIRKTDADILDGEKAGTYVCIVAAPAGMDAPERTTLGEHWEELAKGQWSTLVIKSDSNVKTIIDGGDVTAQRSIVVGTDADDSTHTTTTIQDGNIQTDGTVVAGYEDGNKTTSGPGYQIVDDSLRVGGLTGGGVIIETDACLGKTLTVREMDVCVDGQYMKVMGIFSAPYFPP